MRRVPDDRFGCNGMKTPSFWYRKKGWQSFALTPFSALYRAGTLVQRARAKPPSAASVPVLCVGNIVAGGAGKTPTALALANLLLQDGHAPVFVSRGYGGAETGPLRVDPVRHTARNVGDEALLLARAAPCWIGPDRAQALCEAAKEGAVVLLDDGLQNTSVKAGLNILVIDGDAGLGSGCLLPACPLRETAADSRARVDALVIIGHDHHACASLFEKPVLMASFNPSLDVDFLSHPDVLAFAGIGRPAKFYATCKKAGLNVVQTCDFPDHHAYTAHEIEGLSARANEKGLRLITTAKDFVRIPESWRKNVSVLAITLAWQDQEAAGNLCARLFESRRRA